MTSQRPWAWSRGRGRRPRPHDHVTDPDPEVPATPAEYRLRILTQADACKKPGEVGALLRREGL